MPISVVRLVATGSASYQGIDLWTADELAAKSVPLLFKDNKTCAWFDGRYNILSVDAISLIHVHKLHPEPQGSLPFHKIVVDGVCYNGGYIVPQASYAECAIDPTFSQWWPNPLAFVSQSGTFITDSAKVSLLVLPITSIINRLEPQSVETLESDR